MRVGWASSVNDRRIASFRYRVEAPAAGLNARGHKVELFDPTQADQYDVVVFSKAYSAEHRALARSVKRRGGRVVFDICDNHFYNPYDLPKYSRAREQIIEMMSIADRVVCSTPALASVVKDETGGEFDPIVVGDIVERFKPRKRAAAADQPLRLTWFGSHGSPNAPSGMTDLLLIREQLEALAAKRDIELTVCSNSREKFESAIAPLKLPTRYVEWSLQDFPGVLAQSDAALLPMDINPFTACKTHNRLTTALYSGVPVIASSIESYREFDRYCTLDAWAEGLDALVEAGAEQRQRALASRPMIDQRWTIEALASRWEAALALPTASSVKSQAMAGVRLHGRLDAVARGSVTGWVHAPVQPDVRLQVVLECDGEPVAVAVADRSRDDLKSAGLAADCGFSLPLPPRAVGAHVSRLAVRVLDTDWIVGENPIVLSTDEEPRFTPAREKSAPSRVQRWDVAESISAQERLLAELEIRQARQKAHPTEDGFESAGDDQAGQPSVSFQDVMRAGATDAAA